MKFKEYLKDKFFVIFSKIIILILVLFLLIILKAHILLIITIPILLVFNYVYLLLRDYFYKRNFYKMIFNTIMELDKKYLLTEIVKKSDFLEGKMLLEYFYEINKNYCEEVNIYKQSLEDFKEYIELWCHEIKTPVATSKLILENKSKEKNESMLEEINKIDGYIEQVLYYAKSEFVEKDYFINKINLSNIVNNVIKKNKKVILQKKIKVKSLKEDYYIYSDEKWLEYIINQIVINSIKYVKDNPEICFKCDTFDNCIILKIKDNGIGIKEEELSRIFDKGFTGSTGRIYTKSTGMGLYLVKKLCDKLGHSIKVSSVLGEYTEMILVFPINSMTK